MIRYRALAAILVALSLQLPAHAATAEPFSCRSRAADAHETVISETTLAGVPAILRVPRTIAKAPIVLWHGFGPPASERALMDTLPLDDVPAVKVYLGLPLFGRRAEPGGIEALKRRQQDDVALQVFEPIVVGAAKELPAVLKALQALGCASSGDRIGVFGFSAGGATTLFALAERDVPIAGAVVVNASTGLSASVAAYERATKISYAWSPAARALARRTDAAVRAHDIAAGHPALLIVQSAADAVVSPDNASALEAALRPHYAQRDAERLQLALEPDLTHDITAERGIALLRARVADWFNRYLDEGRR